MSEYLVCIKQDGEGCDYTIGCGMKFYLIDADTMHDAKEKVIYPYGKNEGNCFDMFEDLVEILIVPFHYVTKVNVSREINIIREAKKIEARSEEEIKERAELKRLQEKYK